MSKNIKVLAAFGFIVLVSACAREQQEESVVVEPISSEPVYTGKYK